MVSKPSAVVRRDIIASTGPSIYGIKRMDKVLSARGEAGTFLGVCDGIVYVELDDKAKGDPFVEMESEDFARWKKI